MTAAATCATCVFFRTTYVADVEEPGNEYQNGTCTANDWTRTTSLQRKHGRGYITISRDAQHECHRSEPLPIAYPGVF